MSEQFDPVALNAIEVVEREVAPFLKFDQTGEAQAMIVDYADLQEGDLPATPSMERALWRLAQAECSFQIPGGERASIVSAVPRWRGTHGSLLCTFRKGG